MISLVIANVVGLLMVVIGAWHLGRWTYRRAVGQVEVSEEVTLVTGTSLRGLSLHNRDRYFEGVAADLVHHMAARTPKRTVIAYGVEVREDPTAFQFIVKVTADTVAVRKRPTILEYSTLKEIRRAA